MSQPPEIDQLARRYLDLWQDQLAGMTGDPEWLATVSRAMANVFAAGMAGMPSAMPNPWAATGFAPPSPGADAAARAAQVIAGTFIRPTV